MKETLEKFLINNKNGLFLLDSPTGFGKTTAVLEILEDFLKNKQQYDVKRMFFVTNLKANLPFGKLTEKLNEDLKHDCLYLKSYEEDVVANWNSTVVHEEGETNGNDYKVLNALRKTNEYKYLSSDIKILNDYKSDKERAEKDGNYDKVERFRTAIQNQNRKISTTTEPAFRELIIRNYFQCMSLSDKKDFIKNNEWFIKLYPICRLPDKKVIFMTTSKFFSKINLFYKSPFFIYEDDELLKNSVVFIDEFDSSKRAVVDILVENSLKVPVDAVALFTNIHYVLQSLNFPKELLKMAEKCQEDKPADKGESINSERIIESNRKVFDEKYNEHKLFRLIKSTGFNYSNAFLFDDGNYITINRDDSKRHLIISENVDTSVNELKAVSKTSDTDFANLIWDINCSIKYFAKGIKMLSQNYLRYINSVKEGKDHQYSKEEAQWTILNAFNLSGENSEYIRNLINDTPIKTEDKKTTHRKGFRFTEVQDSNYHNLQSVTHQFDFKKTPDDLIIEVASKARLIGISATASIETVIGNYDIKYLSKKLGAAFVRINNEDSDRIKHSFMKSQNVYDKVDIKVNVIDETKCSSRKEQIDMLLKKIYNGEILNKYIKEIGDKEKNEFHDLIMVKLAYLYYEIGTGSIKSFIAFVNSHPKENGSRLDLKKLKEMFEHVRECNHFNEFPFFVLLSENFDAELAKVHKTLKEGDKCFVISTYWTVGSGKNIQYDMSECDDDIIIKLDDALDSKIDFDGIFLLTPTNLTQQLDFDSADKYSDLIKYLYQQQCLHLSDKLDYKKFMLNVVSGFRKTFYMDYNSYFISQNTDKDLHTTQIIIQAVGRICRCRNKNKTINIYCEADVIKRIQKVKPSIEYMILNQEFKALLNYDMKDEEIEDLSKYSDINKSASAEIRNKAVFVRSTETGVEEWKKLREYVLKNPTAKTIDSKYEHLYFNFDSVCKSYSYKKNNKWDFIHLEVNGTDDEQQVSAIDSELFIFMQVPCIRETFERLEYSKSWKREKWIMSQSLYQQVYKGALGEISGKIILEKYLGWQVNDIDDLTLYEYFDFKIKNTYIDFKHWNNFKDKREDQIKSIKWKMKRSGGGRAIIINLIKRGEHQSFINIDEDIIEIPYIINENNEVDEKMIEEIRKNII